MARNWIYHNSHDLFYRNPFGAVPCNQQVELKIKLQLISKIDTVTLRIWKEGEDKNDFIMTPLQGEEGVYFVQITTPPTTGLLWYYFMVVTNGRGYYYGNNVAKQGGIGEISEQLPRPYQITVYQNKVLPPTWFYDAVIYQIFVDRFYNGNEDGKVLNPKKNSLIHAHWENDPIYIKDEKTGRIARWDFFGGNLIGVKKKLPYLKDLGIRIIYFNPIFEAQSNHKYDTGDYHKIDPMFGDEEIFLDLVNEAKKLGISIILDGVFSHTGSDSIYFNKEGNYPSIGAYQSKNSPYFSWYRFNEFPDWYDCWWGIDLLPNVNELDTSYQNFVIYGQNSVLKHWLSTGIKGWRLDVADELPDTFIKRFKEVLKEQDSEAVLIGEVWEDASNKISYGQRREYFYGEELDSVTNYPFRKIVIDFLLGHKDAFAVHSTLMSLYENYPIHYFYSLMNLLGSHDVPRILTVLQEELPQHLNLEQKRNMSIARLKIATLWQMTFPGVPSIYYGDEVGLQGGNDPFNRRGYPWGRENHDLLEWFQKMIAIRNDYDVLRTGEWISLFFDSDVYGFVRQIKDGLDALGQRRKANTAIVLFNRNLFEERRIVSDISKWVPNGRLKNLLNLHEEIVIEDGVFILTLKPLEGKLLIRDQ
ncbi:glycoside hydrolase family 13 protein [Tepidibacillus fermentans]|uniref:Glycosidase n=1 Tax=Tepidibacillus fermentans TaxID=1281767 RepID=A0A4R3KCV9_9BACI|nr:glycoside hydrolase family 13 protein [Tepidibacillus fermentans]TCS81076.1 glycosidase [Tepidibacillus fermentans]